MHTNDGTVESKIDKFDKERRSLYLYTGIGRGSRTPQDSAGCSQTASSKDSKARVVVV